MLGLDPGRTAFVLLFVGLPTILGIYCAWKHLMRTIRVMARGWPPAHLDIDGKFHPEVEIFQEEML